MVIMEGSRSRPSSSLRLYPSGLLSRSLTFHSFTVLSGGQERGEHYGWLLPEPSADGHAKAMLVGFTVKILLCPHLQLPGSNMVPGEKPSQTTYLSPQHFIPRALVLLFLPDNYQCVYPRHREMAEQQNYWINGEIIEEVISQGSEPQRSCPEC